MAKNKSIIKLSGTIDGITHVNSKAYGPHVRSARFTHSKVVMSAALRDSSAKQTTANLRAKIVFDEVKVLAPDFKDGKFWSRLLKVFRQQQSGAVAKSYAPLRGIEVRSDYPSTKHGRFTLEAGNGTEMMSLNYQRYEQRSSSGNKAGSLDGAFLNFSASGAVYNLTLLRLAADETLLHALSSQTRTHCLTAEPKQGLISFNFPVLPDGAQVLYVLKVERLENGEVTGVMGDMGVVFL